MQYSLYYVSGSSGQGGSIDVKSELGKGTVFNLILTQQKADENYYEQKTSKIDAADMEISLRGKHILLAEDNDLNAEYGRL